MRMPYMKLDVIRAQALGSTEAIVPSGWSQGRTVFGGLSAALLSDRLSRGIEEDRRLRYLEIGFVRPLAPDQPFRIESDAVSAGRTIAVQSGRIVQDDDVRVTAQANYVRALDSAVVIETFEPPEFKPADHEAVTRVEGPGTPAFTQFIDFRIATPGGPFTGRGSSELGGWMRFDDPPDRLSTAHLICLIDAWPPVPSSYYDRPVPLSSINWQMHFAGPFEDLPGTDFLGYRARCNFFRDGYGSSSAEIWAPDGRLLAKSFQTFLVFG
jgi:acyl-CoA thioesterase